MRVLESWNRKGLVFSDQVPRPGAVGLWEGGQQRVNLGSLPEG